MPAEGGHPSWLVEPLAQRHDRGAFSSGNEALDHYLSEQAGQDAKRRAAAPFVLVAPPDLQGILGYHTLSAFGIDLDELPSDVARKLPAYPVVPATLLGRLAVDHRHTGKGLGEFLLIDALRRALAQSAQIAATAVVVDAIDDQAVRFYEHFGFIPLPSRRNRLFLPMQTIAALFRGA